eukprot:TRINITY_DN3006_c0_g1_i1.p1 TRINITY_DN3006_c0_g1~~TRINITY_DN3006_c0_g1_i1.p1  ORF type:complete len:404 (+),score=68.97 TRINITY_DN3006_c0_g1_i1:67-1278(+)
MLKLITTIVFSCLLCILAAQVTQLTDPIATNDAAIQDVFAVNMEEGIVVETCRLVKDEKTSLCPEIWEPVCGDDNVTYVNCCFADEFLNKTQPYTVGDCGEDTLLYPSDLFNNTPSGRYREEDFPLIDEDPSTTPTSTKINKRRMLKADGFDVIMSDGVDSNIPLFDFESIIGTNELITIQSTTIYPFNAIGKFKDRGCTGFLVGPRHILTAAHCIYDRRDKAFFRDLDWVPAQNGNDTKPFGTFIWKTARVTSQYANEGDINYDFGLVITKENFTRDDFFAYGFDTCEKNQRNYTMNLAGYRQDAPEFPGRMWVSPCENVQIKCNSETQEFEPMFPHECDTTTGMAGAPLWVYRLEEEGLAAHSIRGIHLGTDPSGSQKFNQALYVSPTVQERIQGWIDEEV